MSIKAKPNQLKVQFGKLPGEKADVVYAYGENCDKADIYVLKEMLDGVVSGDKTVLSQLKERGYDLSTLKFSIDKKTQE